MTSTRARVEDVHELAAAMPNVKVIEGGSAGNPVYQVGGKSFVFFRTPRPDARDPETGEKYDDVIVLWVSSQEEKQSLVQDAWLSQASKTRRTRWLKARGIADSG